MDESGVPRISPAPTEPAERTHVEAPPTMDELLAADVLVWADGGGQGHVRAKSDIDSRDVATWLRHIADHLSAATPQEHQ